MLSFNNSICHCVDSETLPIYRNVDILTHNNHHPFINKLGKVSRTPFVVIVNFAGIEDDIVLIEPDYLQPIESLKEGVLIKGKDQFDNNWIIKLGSPG